MNLRMETIQVAAVAAAIIEDMNNGSTGFGHRSRMRVWDDIEAERVRQEEKWGPQHHDPLTWLMILMEEVGEMAEEIDPGPGSNFAGDATSIRSNIIHAGAEAKKWLERNFSQ